MERKLINSPSFFIGKGEGDNLISFGSGQPDLPPPDEVFDITKNYRSFKYGLIQGQPHLREALSRFYEDSNPDDFVITNGASEAIDLSLRAVHALTGGSKVLLFRPYYYSYPHNVRFADMEAKYSDLKEGKIDIEDFKKQIEGCKAVIINSPANPTGSVQDKETLLEIDKVCREKGIYILSDNVYKDLVYDDEAFYLEGEHVITIDSFSKSYSMCGIRVGYLYTPNKDFVDKVIEMKTHTSMNTGLMAQEMAFAATNVPESFLLETLETWRKRRDLFYRGMLDLGLDVIKPEGAFYLFPKIKNPDKAINDLYYDHNLIAYSGSWFGDDERMRFSYALDVEKIEIGLERLGKYLEG